jgi:hypothetical protein
MIGLFKREQSAPFAARDTHVFVPLCLLIAALCALVGRSDPAPRRGG